MPPRPAVASALPADPAPKRVALYTRVSTDIQANKDEGSLDTQEARLRSAVASRQGAHNVSHVFREEGESGKSLDRPALQQLLAGARARQFDLVVVTRIDRLSRSLLDFYEVHRLFEENGVTFTSLNESFDTSQALGRAMLKLVLVFAELEREQTAERTRTALRARAERGLWNGGHPPLGYDSEGNGHIKVNEVEAELVRGIFAKYEETRSTNSVFHWLKDAGHRQKTYTSRRRGASGGKAFTVGGIQHLLQNRLYLGEIDHKGDIFEGQHPAIIDRETFDRAQAIFESNNKGAKGLPLRAQYDYLLTGVLRCACGHALTTSAGNGKGGRYHYYRCVGIMKKPDHPCPVRQVRAETIDELVMGLVRDAARDPKLIEDAVAEANRMAREQVDPLRKRVEQLRRELAEAEDQAGRVLAQILSAGIAASATAKRLLADAEDRQTKLRTSLSQAEGELATRETEHLDHEAMIAAIQGFDVAFDHLTLAEKREFMQLMCKHVELHPDHVVVELYEGRTATRYLTGNKRLQKGGGGVPGGGGGVPDAVPGEHEGREQKQRTPDRGPGFVTVSEWLPVADGRKNVAGGG
jgi:site-specific DNA recombinase